MIFSSRVVHERYGARVGISFDNSEVASTLRDNLGLSINSNDTSDVDVLYSVRRNGHCQPEPSWDLFKGTELLNSTSDVMAALRHLESDMHLEIALHARTGLFVHAGVVGWNGRAILIPGRSLAGKSTLVAALVRQGATYFSDEYAVIDSVGCAHPYLKPVSLRNPDRTTRKVNVLELGGRAATDPIPVGAVTCTKYRSGASWHPRQISKARTLLYLMDNTVVAQLKPQLALQCLSLVALRAIGWKGLRGDADETAERLLQQLDTCEHSSVHTQ